MTPTALLTLVLRHERDVVLARQRARQLAGLLGFDVQDQTRLSTAVSEIARNALVYAGGGKVEFALEGSTAPQVLVVRTSDSGPGIRPPFRRPLRPIRSPTGMGVGMIGARRLMEHFRVQTAPGRGTVVELKKSLPRSAALIGRTLVLALADQLDLAKVEAGKIEVRPVEFDVGHLFGALRGMLRPLLVNESVVLVCDEPAEPIIMHTDEAKVSQIIRNFISNALTFTERGEVRVSAHRSPDGRAVTFTVADTGIGIEPEHLDTIFQEFTQIDSAIQRRVKGTGLGLPLCRRLAELLGGGATASSRPQVGSTFTAVIPTFYQEQVPAMPAWIVDDDRLPVLVVDDGPDAQLAYERMLAASTFQPLPARTLREARQALGAFRPRAIVLDILLRGEDAWSFLGERKRRDDTRDIPVLVVSTVDDRAKAMSLGADAYCPKPIDRQTLLQQLLRLIEPHEVKRILVVDDEEIFRYVLHQHLLTPQHAVFEAASGREALRYAQSVRPDVICLDLIMPDLDGFQVLQALKGDPTTRDIPVVVITSKPLDASERKLLLEGAVTILSKERVSREDAMAAVDAAIHHAREVA